MHKHSYIFITFLSIIGLLVSSCQQQTAQSDEPQQTATPKDSTEQLVLLLSPDQMKTIDLDTTSLKQTTIRKNMLLMGKVSVSPTHLTSLSSVVGGHIKTLHIIPGQRFSKGQVLATIADMQVIQLQQDYLTAKADWTSVKENFERQQTLNAQQATSDKNLQLARAEFQKLNATVHALEQKLRLLHIDPTTLQADNIRQTIQIYAPFSGTVNKVFVNTGQYVTPTDIICELIDPRGFILQLNTFEKNLPGLQNGQKIAAYTNDNPKAKSTATIINRVSSLDDDGAGIIYATLDQPNPTWVTGTYVNADVAVNNYIVNSLPQRSVVSFENKQYVFVKTGESSFQLHAVDIGESSDGRVEIRNPAQLADMPIVQKGAYDLLMAMKNKPEE
ncbi:efflux RND transporter periplasmic adaptor subunit [Sphingobacterium paludis]|uniref:Cobalt-zinc-cadmium efflux system membrane fusion protein n=1 Tax=Sphingobacterium paludis TaxID=1476465 RepID=A0A4V3E156_9SPHI|nr:efflux RND transporter periplasmic adaptor subunit [Sphingobacterium paludis]TDS10986.1 cobalt-zinc-cadmium efflux system membrane fusion protein [Sphingobacterium paludis]